MKVVLIVGLPQGNRGAVIFASRRAAEKWREVADEKGIETYGMLSVISRVNAALLWGGTP